MSGATSLVDGFTYLSVGRIGDYTVYTSGNLTVPDLVSRTWAERLFTWPWRPLQKLKTVRRPDPNLYRVGRDVVVGHPATVEAMRQTLTYEAERERERAREQRIAELEDLIGEPYVSRGPGPIAGVAEVKS